MSTTQESTSDTTISAAEPSASFVSILGLNDRATATFVQLTESDEDAEKRLLIDKMIAEGRLYYKPPALPKYIQVLSTAIWIYPSDILHPALLEHKIDEAIHYHGSLDDHYVFNALANINPDHAMDKDCSYMVMALYLYLANEVSLNPNSKNKTFLRACRDNGLELKGHQMFSISDLANKFRNVLIDLELDHRPDIMKVVDDWTTTGKFTAHGEENSNDYKTAYKGAYLNRSVSLFCKDHSPIPRNSTVVSYILGMKTKMSEIAGDPDRENLALRAINNDLLVDEAIERGDKLRHDRIQEQVYNLFPAEILAEQGITPPESHAASKVEKFKPEDCIKISDIGMDRFRKLLMLEPTYTLKINYHTGACIAWGESNENVADLVPADTDMLGNTPDGWDGSRNCTGLNDNRYNMLLMRDSEQNRMADTIAHETVHRGMHYVLNNAELRERIHGLEEEWEQVCEELATKDLTPYPAFTQWDGFVRKILSPGKLFDYPLRLSGQEKIAYGEANRVIRCTKEIIPTGNPWYSCGNDDAEPELAGTRRVSQKLEVLMTDIASHIEKHSAVSSSPTTRQQSVEHSNQNSRQPASSNSRPAWLAGIR